MKDDTPFGMRLRATRVAAGLSQSDLEELSGIPKARLSRYENGHVVPSIQTLERLAEALHVSEATLLGDQRAILEEFFNVLYDRGVRIQTSEQGAKLAAALADMIEAARQPAEDAPAADEPETSPSVEEIREWIGAGQSGPGVDR